MTYTNYNTRSGINHQQRDKSNGAINIYADDDVKVFKNGREGKFNEYFWLIFHFIVNVLLLTIK